MIAIPVAFLVERHEKEIGLLQPLQRRLSVVPAGERVTERRAHPLEDRRAQQKRLNLGGLRGEHFLAEIRQYMPMAPPEGGDKLRRVRMLAQRKPGELQSC